MNGILEYVNSLQANQGKCTQSTTMHESQPLAEYGLDTVECAICHNTGTLVREDENGCRIGSECACMAQRRSLRRISRSGLSDAVRRNTFGSYQTPDDKRVGIKAAAERFCADTTGSWFFIAGSPGSGKSHICTGIAGELLTRSEVRYCLWRDDAVKIKAAVMDRDAYAEMIEPLKAVPVLYIDDFLKGKVGEADVNLAFELINARYLDSRKRTIISSERTLPEIMQIDEAIGSRIYERAKSFVLAAPSENWRMRT